MSKGSGTTRKISASAIAESRTLKVKADTKNGGVNNQELPKGWSLNPYKKNSYDTNIEISSQAMYGLREIYGEKFSTGHTLKGTSITTESLELAKSIAKDGENLTKLIDAYNKVPSSLTEHAKYYEKEILTYISNAKKKHS